jgi:hypothetical protein
LLDQHSNVGPISRILSDPERQYLEARGVSPEAQAATGYWTEFQPSELLKLGFSSKQAQYVPALVTPIRDVAGVVIDHEIRPRNPRKGLNGKVHKKERPAGSQQRLNFSALTFKHADNPLIPLIICEAITKADAVAQWPDATVCAVSMSGTTGFRGFNSKGGSTFLADFEAVALKGKTPGGEQFGREIYVVTDSDVATNSQVLSSVRRLAAILRNRGANVHIIMPPQPAEASDGAV